MKQNVKASTKKEYFLKYIDCSSGETLQGFKGFRWNSETLNHPQTSTNRTFLEMKP